VLQLASQTRDTCIYYSPPGIVLDFGCKFSPFVKKKNKTKQNKTTTTKRHHWVLAFLWFGHDNKTFIHLSVGEEW